MLKLLRNSLLALSTAVITAGPASAELTIRITDYAGKQTPVAIVPFAFTGEGIDSPLDVADVIAADLRRSGRFAPIAEDDMLQMPSVGSDVDFGDWSILGVEAVVIGRVTQTAANVYSVQFQLFDVFRGIQLVGYRMPASRGTIRRVAHRLADMIYEKLTGIQGVFATQVAYITAQGADQKVRIPMTAWEPTVWDPALPPTVMVRGEDRHGLNRRL